MDPIPALVRLLLAALLMSGAAPAPDPAPRYGWPLQPAPAVVTPFRAPAQPYGPGHRGVDLAGTVGQPVLAARDGTVVFAGAVGGHGAVSVQHDDGLRTTYQPVTPAVATGAVVAAGAVLGTLDPGHPGCPAAACLHWGVRRDRTEYLDPLVLLRPPVVRLLPLPDPWPGAAVLLPIALRAVRFGPLGVACSLRQAPLSAACSLRQAPLSAACSLRQAPLSRQRAPPSDPATGP